MPTTISKNKRLMYFVVFTAIFIVAIPIVVLYSTGYSIDDTFSLTKRGGIYMYIPEPGTEVYLKDEHRRTTGIFQKEVLIKDLKPDTYLVVVSNEKFEPWAKFLTVKAQEVVSAFPLLVPKTIPVKEIARATTTTSASTSSTNGVISQYQKTLLLFKPQPVIMPSGKVTTVIATTTVIKKKTEIWSDNGSIFAAWKGNYLSAPPYFCDTIECEQKVTVFAPKDAIRHIDFYPGRDDVVIASFSDGIYAIEIDTREYQNFYRLYKGNSPDFRIDNGIIYVKDGDFLGIMDVDV